MPGTFEQSARREIRVVITDVFVGTRAPMSRHLDPNFAIHVSTEKGCFDIASLELESILCSDSQHRPQCHRFCNRSEGVVEVETFFHKLSANHDTSLELLSKFCSSIGAPRCLILNTHPAGTGLGHGPGPGHSSPKVPFLRWHCFSLFMASRH